MKPIKWNLSANISSAQVGCVCLSCHSCKLHRGSKYRWYANVYIPDFPRSFRYGRGRESLLKSQEDAVGLAKEILSEFQACLNVELANFGLELGDEE